MPKINVYLPDDLADAVRDAGVPVSAVCQRALEQAVRRITAIRETALTDLDADQLAARLPALTARARDVLSRSRAQAQVAGVEQVGTAHLLAALLDEGDNLGVRVLRAIEVEPARLARALSDATGGATPRPAAAGVTAAVALRFGGSCAAALELAVTEATGLGHNYVGCEHLLLGLIAEPGGTAGQVLRGLGAELRVTRRAVAAALAGYVHLRAQTPAVPADAGADPPASTGDPIAAVTALIRRELAPITQRLDRLEARFDPPGAHG
ncbi:Clp protease N-terminal domain-containing protein [Solwaraspora sp. WMMB335]|uniref:Clp protease N-terminal domain-containing protein n=1 Tax=Solwaraspora sp. WMMB335 TaxID=3404118 RepID=UPI003B936077